MSDWTESLEGELLGHGADLVGFADLNGLPPEQRLDMSVGIAVAVKYPKDVIKGIMEMPTMAYYDQYRVLNEKLDLLVTFGAGYLQAQGFQAIACTRDFIAESDADYTTRLPHKNVARLAGLGWIGKSALLVTERYGSMIRLSSILTDAPLRTASPVNESKCGECQICTQACPAGAVRGKNWTPDTYRDEIFNPYLCRKTARERAVKGFGIEITICGRCIAVCPYTQRYLNGESS